MASRKPAAGVLFAFGAAAWFVGFILLAGWIPEGLGVLQPICVVVGIVGMVPWLQAAHRAGGGKQPYP